MQQIGIYRYYNLQHLNSGPASNIISNQVTFTIYFACYYCYFI
ncbi:unnamed protein product [Brassica rapa]|uniref:Uncharacterized protein n=1 Tax=Brassica campestris TaxID=3711 RepID=A0A8D9HG52_BRACM|nr:unnamed protein product [Brassica rapa]